MPKVELNLEDDELKELLLGDRDKAMQSIMAKILDEILKSEATEQIKAKAYERSDERTNSRNGYRVRQLTTRVGSLVLSGREAVAITAAYHPRRVSRTTRS